MMSCRLQNKQIEIATAGLELIREGTEHPGQWAPDVARGTLIAMARGGMPAHAEA